MKDTNTQRQHGEKLAYDTLATAGNLTGAGPGFGMGLSEPEGPLGIDVTRAEKVPTDGRTSLSRLMERLGNAERTGERAKALRENLRALYMELPLEISQAANRALEDLVRGFDGRGHDGRDYGIR